MVVFACISHVPPAVFVMLVLRTAMEALHKLIIQLLHYKVVSGRFINVAFFGMQRGMLRSEADVRFTVAAVVFGSRELLQAKKILASKPTVD